MDTWIGLWAEDEVKMNPNSSILQGREAIRDWFVGLPAVTEFTWSVAEIDVRADLAYARGPFSVTFAVEGVPEPVTDVAKFVSIMKKQPDGKWLIAIDIWNSDLPPSQ